MFKSASTSLILRGVLATIVGILALAWPGVTILALIILITSGIEVRGTGRALDPVLPKPARLTGAPPPASVPLGRGHQRMRLAVHAAASGGPALL